MSLAMKWVLVASRELKLGELPVMKKSLGKAVPDPKSKIDTFSKKCTEIQTLILHTSKSQREIAVITGIFKSVVNHIKKKIDENLLLETNRI